MQAQFLRFLARLWANKITTGLAFLVITSGLILAFPKSIAWLPEDTAKALWNFANQTILWAIGVALLFVKQHSTVGDAGRPSGGSGENKQ